MQLGYIGLGKMGSNMVERLLAKKHKVIIFNRSNGAAKKLVKKGATSAESIEDLVKKLRKPKLIWLMLPHTEVDEVLDQLIPLLSPNDTIIDGGNSNYENSIKRAAKLAKKKINFLDAGVSGGPTGARNGACIMVGGKQATFKKYEKLFKDLSAPKGYDYVGKNGAGHFVKMVHNGIEYGMMQAIAEGFGVMKKSNFKLDLKKIANLYNHKSVIESRLVDWLRNAYKDHGQNLDKISGKVAHSGEGLWTVQAAKKLKINIPIIKGALDFRQKSQKKPTYIGKIISALRNQFGGHDVF